MNSAPEYDLLLLSIQLAEPAQALQRAQQILKANTLDWAFFNGLAAGHGIQPQAFAFIQQLPDGVVPAAMLKELQEASQYVVQRQLANVAEFLQIHALLVAEDILAVPYKGFWYAHSIYGNLSEREGGDIDLFINPQDLAKVQKVMQARGYVPESVNPQTDADRVLAHLGEYNFGKYNQEGERIFLVEFHGGVSSYKLGLNIQLQDLQDQVQWQVFRGHNIPVFSLSAQLLLALTHHGAKDAWGSLKQVLDIGKALQRCTDQLDWPWLMKVHQHYDLSRLLYVGLGLAQTLTGVAYPLTLKSKLSASRVKRLMKGRINSLAKGPTPTDKGYRVHAQRLWFFWNVRLSWRKRWGLLWRHLLASPDFTPGAKSPKGLSIFRHWFYILRQSWIEKN